jgi:hypothetical protein
MPKELEDKLKREAAAKGYTGRRADSYVYGTMNKLGLMHGNKATKRQGRKRAVQKMISKEG